MFVIIKCHIIVSIEFSNGFQQQPGRSLSDEWRLGFSLQLGSQLDELRPNSIHQVHSLIVNLELSLHSSLLAPEELEVINPESNEAQKAGDLVNPDDVFFTFDAF